MYRYSDALQSLEDAERTRWAFIDFNTALPDLSNAYDWLCKRFVEDFELRNPRLDLFSLQTLKGVILPQHSAPQGGL